MSLVRVHPVITPAVFDAVLREARGDDHAALCPTHYIEKDNHIAGCFGVNSIPFISTWFSTKRLKVRDTLQAINIMEAVAASHGHALVAVPCPATSPLFPYMPKLGFEDTGAVHIFCKELIKKG